MPDDFFWIFMGTPLQRKKKIQKFSEKTFKIFVNNNFVEIQNAKDSRTNAPLSAASSAGSLSGQARWVDLSLFLFNF